MHSSRHILRLATILCTIVAGCPATATCMVCDEVVVLDEIRANCFASNYERFLEAARNSPTGFAEIDLTECTGDSGDERRGLDRMGVDRSPDAPAQGRERAVQSPLRTMYILDAEGIVCLGRLIENYSGDYEPAQFDLYESCDK